MLSSSPLHSVADPRPPHRDLLAQRSRLDGAVSPDDLPPPNACAVLREHRRAVLEARLSLGLGKPDAETLLFARPDGAPMRPDALSWLWRSACKLLGLPSVSFHALRHTHASALIAAGLDVVAISRRLGHAKPTITLNTYGHPFKKDDSAAAGAIEPAMTRTRGER